MQGVLRGGRSLVLVVAGFIVGNVVATGVALAVDDPETIHACVNANSGSVRVVNSPDDCRNSEYSLDWGTQGPAGPPGADGKDAELPDRTCPEAQFVRGFNGGQLVCADPGAPTGGGGGGGDSEDADGDGFTVPQGDCDDFSSSVYPGAPESINGVDDNCNGYADYIPLAGGVGVCTAGTLNEATGEVEGAVGPSEEIPGDGLDNDCDGQADEAD